MIIRARSQRRGAPSEICGCLSHDVSDKQGLDERLCSHSTVGLESGTMPRHAATTYYWDDQTLVCPHFLGWGMCQGAAC